MTFALTDKRIVNRVLDRIRLAYNDEAATVAGTNEVQTITFGGTPTGGTFLISFAGETTSAITWSATNATLVANILAALNALSNIYVGDVAVAVGTAVAGIGTITVTFQGTLAKTDVALMTATSSLTGTSPTVGIAETTPGVPLGPGLGYLTLDSRDVQFDEQITTLTTQGTTVTHEKDTVNVFRVNLSNQVFQVALNKAMLGDPTTSGIAGVAERTGYDGSYRSRYFQLEIELAGTDLDTGLDTLERITFWKMQPKQYRPIAGATAKQVPEQTVQLTATQTTTDILSRTIVGLKNTTNGDFYSIDLALAA